MKYETVIGLEVHAELATDSKIFCSCGVRHLEEANRCVCPACCGMPGMLPVTNRRVVELGMTAGLLTNSRINRCTTFDKKSYYYPDLPCSYQITQWFSPICVDGYLDIDTPQGKKTIHLKQIHMEEDAGKLVHDDWTDTSMVDFNRTSVPLIEIVSKPDLRGADDVEAYLNRLRELLRFAGVSEARWEEGSMRCDVNLSIRPEGTQELGVRTEMKNMNSMSAIRRAIDYEVARHIDCVEGRSSEVLIQETRGWDDGKGRSFPMRQKETAADYRYFPDPNLAPILIDDAWLARVQAELPVLPEVKRAQLTGDYGLSEQDAALLTGSRTLCRLFDDALSVCSSPKEIANWIAGDCMNLARQKKINADRLHMDGKKLGQLIGLVTAGKINRGQAKKVLAAIEETNCDPLEYSTANGLLAGDGTAERDAVAKVIAANENMVAQFRAGNTKVTGALFGLVKKELRGGGDPAAIQKLLTEALQ